MIIRVFVEYQMKRTILISVIICLCMTVGLWAGDTDTDSDTGSDSDANVIREIMDKQLQQWNKGSVDGFMKGYWKSEKFTFQSGNKRLLGYNQLAAMYKKNYAGAKMGTLTFKDIVIKPLAEGLYMVLGRWNVTTNAKKDNQKEGLFTLIFRKINGSWKIIHDHSS